MTNRPTSRGKYARALSQLALTTSICLFWLPEILLAQPGQPQPDLAQLQRQLAAIQAQIANSNPTQTDDDPFSGSRVKNVGSQRRKRPPAPVDDDNMHIRLYDLSDIFAVSPHYPAVLPNEIASPQPTVFVQSQGQMTGGSASGGFGGGGFGGAGAGGVFSIPPGPAPKRQEAEMMNLEAAQVSMNQLVAAIKATVSPRKWGGGEDEAKIQFLGNTLLITANNNMHQQITNLLDLFREHWGKLRTVSVQSYWVRASATQARELLSREATKSIGAGVVVPERWKSFLESAKTEKRLAYSVTLTGHNNQTLHAISGRQKQLTLDAIPFEATTHRSHPENGDTESTSVVGFKPVSVPFHCGAAIQVTPLATRGGNFVILDLHAKANELVQNENAVPRSVFAKIDGVDEKAEVKLDSSEHIAYRLSTTVRCPKEQVVLAGGMTYDATADSDDPNLYLFVKVSVHTIEEDQSDWSKTDTVSK